MHSELDNYTKDQLYAILSAVDSRVRTDLIYHCRKAAEEMEKDAAETKDEAQKKEINEEISLLRSMQALATRAEEDIAALDK